MFAARTDNQDPLCKLTSESTNEHYRMCVVISTSSYFQTEIEYPRRVLRAINPCLLKEIVFKTEAGEAEAANTSYHERMIPCYSTYKSPRVARSILYISRAYTSAQVFVYRPDSVNGNKVYLVNLSTRVEVVDELNSFEFVED